MTILLDHIVLIVVALLTSYPLIRRPLSEDDGNWYYFAFFRDRGVRLYRGLTSAYGYFGIFGIAALFFRLFRAKTPQFFKYFKALWYVLNVLAVFWVTFVWTANHGMALIASLVLCLVMVVPNTLFFLTYAEHFMILPLSLCLISMVLGLTEGGHGYFLATGLFAGWAVQVKPTALIFAVFLIPIFGGSPDPWTDVLLFLTGLLTLNALPCLFLYRDGGTCRAYLFHTFGGAFGLIFILLERISPRWSHRLIPEGLRTGRAFSYLQGHHHMDYRQQAAAFRRFLGPALNDLRVVWILASVQIVGIFIGRFDSLTLGMMALMVLCLFMQQIQKNYYTPHFNTLWMPLSVLCAKTLWEAMASAIAGSIFGWLAIAYLVAESVPLAKKITRSFRYPEEIGFLGPVLGALFGLSEKIGHFIRQQSRPGDKLLVWGDQPSIYLYSEREAFDPDYLFLYTHMGRIHDAEEQAKFLRRFRQAPPEWIIFFQYKCADSWSMERLAEAAGVPYRFVNRFQLKDGQGKGIHVEGGIVMDFPLFCRDDDLYRDILMERAAMALASADTEDYLMQLNKIRDILPGDLEVGIRCEAANRWGGSTEGLRKYLEGPRESETPVLSSLIALMIGDLDRREGRFGEAARRYEEASKVMRHDFRIFSGLSEIAYVQGDMEGAVTFLERAYRLNPYSAEVHNNLGVLHALKGDRDGARVFYEKALNIIPGYRDARDNLDALYAEGLSR